MQKHFYKIVVLILSALFGNGCAVPDYGVLIGFDYVLKKDSDVVHDADTLLSDDLIDIDVVQKHD